MLDTLTSLPFTAVLADLRFPGIIACAVLAGTVRGFSGFGSALVYVPLMSALYSPQIAVGSLIMIDLAGSIMLLATVWRHTEWRAVLPMAAAGIVAAQFGAVILQYADVITLRWAIVVIVLGVVVLLASGWRYHGKPTLPITLFVGVLSGLLGGSMQISGPPVIAYWLGGLQEVMVIRANFVSYFALLNTGSLWTFIARGLISPEAIAIALLTGPLQIFTTWIGTRLFAIASAEVYRRVAYLVIAMVAIVSMPLLDGLWR